MKKLVCFLSIVLALLIVAVLCIDKRDSTSVNNSVTPQNTQSAIEIARNNVIEKWETAAGELGTGRYIEDIYKQYPYDEVISNIYYYSTAKNLYGHYESLNDQKYLDQAIEYAEKIDPNYKGKFSAEMHSFVKKLIPSGVSNDKHEAASSEEERYNRLTRKEKKQICDYIDSRYEYYDALYGGYSGDRYSDVIMQEAADKYNLTVTHIEIIWMNKYSYS